MLKSIPELVREYGQVLSKDQSGIIRELAENDTEVILSGLKEQATGNQQDVQFIMNLLDIAFKVGSIEGYSAGVAQNFGDRETIVLYPEGVRDVAAFIEEMTSLALCHCNRCAIGTNIQFVTESTPLPEGNN
ncbi:MAG: hypothetical protein H6Q75_418 [Firmicutes bacterium]|nr:hypothetical protein [Bacillota bacterium]